MLTSKSKNSTDTRYDSPHSIAPVAMKGRAKSSVLAATGGEEQKGGSAPDLAVQLSQAALQKQADSLAERLQKRQQQLDHREALLNARQESLQQETRTERLRNEQQRLSLEEEAAALAEHADSLAELATEREKLSTQTRALANREAALKSRMQKWETAQAEFAAREAAIDQREAAMEARFDELRRRELAVERDEETLGKRGDVQSTVSEVTDLRERLHEAHKMLLGEVEAASQERERLKTLREQLNNQITESRERIHAAKQQNERERLSRSQALDGRQKRLDRREDLIEQLKADVSHAHRETLEMRLIVEELWGRLARTTAPEELSQGFAKARQSLANHFQLTLDAIAEQSDQLRQTGAMLEAKVLEFNDQREAFQSWHAQRLKDIESQAARLIARENELSNERQRMLREEEVWRSEKLQLQARLHEMLSNESLRAA